MLAVFAQNILLDRAIGMNSIMTAISRKRSLLRLLIPVGCWSTVGIMFMWFLSRFVTDMNSYIIIVVGAPISALSSGIPNWYSALGYAVGSVAGLGLGAVIIKNGMEILDHPNIPKAFRGMPIMLIYIGILSLGFCIFL